MGEKWRHTYEARKTFLLHVFASIEINLDRAQTSTDVEMSWNN